MNIKLIIRKLIQKYYFDTKNKYKLDKIHILFDDCRRLLKSQPEKINMKKAQSLIKNIWHTVFSNAILSFIVSLERFSKNESIEQKTLLEPILHKWKYKIDIQNINEHIFNEFKNDLKIFSMNNPNFSDDEWNLDSFFEKKIWKECFQSIYDDAFNTCVSLENHLYNKESKVNNSKIEFSKITNHQDLTPYEFEELIAVLFQKMGYETNITSKSGDYGIDVIAKKNEDIIAIQVKQYSRDNNVGNRDVQMLLGAMHLSTVKANKSILITTSDFTVQAGEQAKENPIELWNGEYVNELFKKYF